MRRYSYLDLRSTNLSIRKSIKGKTGGSTGEPLQFYRDKNSNSWGMASLYRFWNWAGLRIGDKKFQFSGGALSGFLSQKSKIRINLENFLTATIVFPAFELTEQNLQKYLEIISKNEKVEYIRGYPSPLYILAKYINSNGFSLFKFKSVLTTAEKLFDYQRNEIEKAFQCTIKDQYGCGEIYSIASQCNEANLYHVADEHVIVETEQTKDNLILARITDLDNFYSPFIRYENGDILKTTDKKCNCGRKLTVIEKIEGRTHDFITTTEGHLIPGEFFPHLFQTIIGIDQYLVIQESIELLRIQIKPNEYFTQVELDSYIAKIKEYVGDEMYIKVEIIEEIPLTNSGKRIFIKSNVPVQFN